MDWIFDNIEKLFPIIIFLLYGLSAWHRRASNKGKESRENPEEAERVRRIQEEIRRKIIARQQGRNPPAEVEPRQVEVEQAPPSFSIPPVVHRPSFVEEQRVRQEELKERLRVTQAARSETARALEISRKQSKSRRRHQQVPEKGETSRSFRVLLKNDLRQKSGIKRAFLLREILGPPIGAETGPLPRK